MNRALHILYGHITVGALLVSTACGESVLGPVFELDPEVEAFVEQMTAHRASVGCAPLTWNWSVAEVALGHSLDMVQRDFFDHVNPDGATPSTA
ncbi:MAG: hypothetical protein OEN00_01520 [Gemmatimonadota bacterium]|nr:hypothetical protein [Gemmatimonadota bacterium]